MKKLTIKQAAKQIDFANEYDFIAYLESVRINGQFSSLKRLFNELNKEAKKIVLLNVSNETREYLIINCL